MCASSATSPGPTLSTLMLGRPFEDARYALVHKGPPRSLHTSWYDRPHLAASFAVVEWCLDLCHDLFHMADCFQLCKHQTASDHGNIPDGIGCRILNNLSVINETPGLWLTLKASVQGRTFQQLCCSGGFRRGWTGRGFHPSCHHRL